MEDITRRNDDFPTRPARLAGPFSVADSERCLARWQEAATQQADAVLSAWMRDAANGPDKALLAAVFGNSSFLSHLLLQHPHLLHQLLTVGADATHKQLVAGVAKIPVLGGEDHGELMKSLRLAKGRIALLVALADISGAWTLEQVTGALSDFAQQCLTLALDAVLLMGRKRGEIESPNADAPSKDSGIIVLGMGKLGGRELNYSSDIDIMIFFEPGRIRYKGRATEQHFMNRLAHDIVTLMQERTAHGYVFRTDLRLRPDPASTPPAITVEAAFGYYESVGQNWERAAMIKARAVAGDIDAGERFLARLAPFMWRRNLDFAAINDVHSIKRQMDSTGSRTISIPGHNIKLGRGGIREIEFYAQIHQLIWGGREPGLRTRATCETLAKLGEVGLISEATETLLTNAYGFLRRLEHRLQMVADAQTHSLPAAPDGIAHIACFMGYAEVAEFEKDLLHTLNEVHAVYASSFQSAEKLGNEGNLVFTGVSHDPETLNTLRAMGYTNPETVSELVTGWHHGSCRATRTKRARELLTELMPVLLKRLSETVNPDAAFLKFNDFLTNLPAGVQLFSLFSINPHLLGLIADIMGSAPTLASTLSKKPELLDAVLYEDFYGPLPTLTHLEQQMEEQLSAFKDFEQRMDALRRFRSEKQFQAGVQMLGRMVTAHQAGVFLANLAEAIIAQALKSVAAEFIRTYGRIAGSRFAIIGAGKLGSREMTFSSDIDLVFIYEVPDFEIPSDGEKGFPASVYFNRLTQRLLSALTAMGRDGRLYEVDTRLRPSGKQGLLAVSVGALEHYFSELAWTFEFMAFAKARVIYGEGSLHDKLDHFITGLLARPRDAAKLKQDVIDMRGRIDKEFGTQNPWDIKYVRGGLIDIDFIAQYLLLLHGPNTPGARPGPASEILKFLSGSRRIDAAHASFLIEADRFLGEIFNMLRLCCDRAFDEPTAPPGLKKLLADSVKEKDFAALKARLIQVEQSVHAHYNSLLS